jgi:hypothetical protein
MAANVTLYGVSTVPFGKWEVVLIVRVLARDKLLNNKRLPSSKQEASPEESFLAGGSVATRVMAYLYWSGRTYHGRDGSRKNPFLSHSLGDCG